MANSLGGAPLLQNGNSSYTVQLGQYANISISDFTEEVSGMITRDWRATYTVEGMHCYNVFITKMTLGNYENISFETYDRMYEQVNNVQWLKAKMWFETVVKTEAGLLKVEPSLGHVDAGAYSLMTFPYTRRSANSRVGSTETAACSYGTGNRRGLLVRELKRMREYEDPYMLTLVHYYANSNNWDYSSSSRNRIDIGLSIVVNIQVSGNGDLEFTVDGPIQHPCSALFYMFGEIQRTGIWKPTLCPHCANIQRQSGSMSCQSDSEDSEGIHVARGSRSSQQSITNDGRYVGDGNGSIYQRCRVYFKEDHSFKKNIYPKTIGENIERNRFMYIKHKK